jgi:hypothetical protein
VSNGTPITFCLDCNYSVRRGEEGMKKVMLTLFIIMALFLNMSLNKQGNDHDDDDDDDHGCFAFFHLD